jgi:uncharacterized RDD family membrane protein YckC
MLVENKGIRILNFCIDSFAIIIFSDIIVKIIGNNRASGLVSLICYFLYYLIFESLNGKTIGKIITKTIVVNNNNTKPNILKVFVRTIIRFYPFDLVSYLFGFENGAHDIFSKTRLKYNKI